MRDYILPTMLFATIASLALTASYHIPFNIPALIVYYGIAQHHPELQKTGDAVEIQFAWVIIKEAWVWGLLTAYHMAFFLPASLLIVWSRTRSKDVDD